jgi:hypothetical protein
MAGRVRDDVLAPLRREEAVCDIDRDALLALGEESIQRQREVDLLAARAVLARIGGERGELVVVELAAVVDQAADERALAVVDAAARDEAEQAQK